MCSRISLRLATKYYFEVKKYKKISISDAEILKRKTEECNQSNSSGLNCFGSLLVSSKAKKEGVRPKNLSSNKFGMLLPGWNTHFLEASAHVSWKVATNNYFRDTKNYENLDF